MINLIDSDKTFDQIQHHFMIKTLNKVGIEGTYLNIIKAIYNKPTTDAILISEKLKSFYQRSGTRQGCPLLSLLFNVVLEVLSQSNQTRQRKGIPNAVLGQLNGNGLLALGYSNACRSQ